MKRKYKRRTSRFGIFFVFLTAVTIAGVFFIPWAMKPDNFRNEKNKINMAANKLWRKYFFASIFATDEPGLVNWIAS